MTDDPRTDDPLRQDVSAGRDAYASGRDLIIYNQYREPRARTKRLRVLVSWTPDDLREHREQVRRALRRLGVEEVESDAGSRPLAEHLNEVRGCDLFLCVLAWRYGPVPEGQPCSLPELELRTARDAGIASLVFLLSDSEPWPPGAVDRGEALNRVDELRAELAAGPDCEYFTSASDLADRVEELVTPRTLDEAPASRADPATAAHWRDYRRRLVQEYGRLDLEALTPPDREDYLQLWLRDVFVEPDVRQDTPPIELSKELWRKLQEATELSPSDVPRGLDRGELEKARRVYRTRPNRPLFDVLARPAERLCVLLGDPGSGKSTIARYLALGLAQDRLPSRLDELDGHQPVLIELRDYAAERARSQCAGFTDYLAHRARTDGLGVPDEALERHLGRGGPALVIFDGLDELFEPRDREAVSREIAWFASSHPTARVLVTSRIVGYRRRVLDEAGFTHYTVQDLGGDQIEEFLTSWYALALHDRPALADQRRERLTRAIDDSPPIRELAGNPLLLTILAIIGKQRELPRERWKVYDHAAGVLVEHWDVNKHLSDARVDADVIREDDKKDLLRRLAHRMQLGAEGRAGNHIWKDDLVEEIVGYLRGRFQYDVPRATAIANVIVEQFRERNFVLARYGPRIYGFVHRALLEFFCAGEIVTRFEKTRALTEEQLREEVFQKYWEEPAWAEVLRLIAGMVDATVTDRLLQHLLEHAEPVRTTALDRPPLEAVTLAVQCLAEVRGLGSTERSSRMLLDAVIDLLRAPDRSFADDRQKRLEAAILPALAAIGPAWPGRDHFLAWFRRQATDFVTMRCCRIAPRILAALYSDSSAVRTMLAEMVRHGGVAGQRSACLVAVVDRWPDHPETRELVVERLHDHADAVRQTAVEQLAARWADDPRALEAVHEALLDVDPDVRQAAVEQLAARWREDPETPAAIRGRLSDPDEDVREAALDQLTGNWATDAGTPSAVFSAARDPYWSVRCAALRALDSSWARTPEALSVLRHAAMDVDEDVRQVALQVLADRWADDPAVHAMLLDAVADPHPQVGAAAVQQLASRWPDHPDTIAALRRAGRSPYGDVQCAAAVALEQGVNGMADPTVVLLGRLTDARNADVRRAAVVMVAREGAEDPEVLRAVLRATADPDYNVRVAAMRELARRWPGHSRLRDICLAGVREFEAVPRDTAVELLALHWGGDPDLLPVFLVGARDPAWTIRKTALATLAACWTGHADAVTAIERLAGDSEGLLRAPALAALATFGDARERATRALDDPHRPVRRGARRLLAASWQASWTEKEQLTEALASPRGAIRRTALSTLIERFGAEDATWDAVAEALEDSELDVRLLALRALMAARRDDAETKSAVLSATHDFEPEIRALALQALLVRWPSDPDTGDAVQRMLRDRSPGVRRTALEGCVRSDPGADSTFDALAWGCADSESMNRKRALESLAVHHADRPDAVAAVLRASDDSSEEVRDDCLKALCVRWHDADGVLTRIHRAALDPSEEVRLTVLQALLNRWKDHDGTLDIVGRFRWDGDTQVRCEADQGLAFLGSDKAVSLPFERPAAVAAVRHPDTRLRAIGLSRLLLAWPDAPETRWAVQVAFQDEKWDVQRIAQADLAHRAPDDATALAVLRSGLASPRHAVRILALACLASALPDDPGCQEELERALGDAEPVVRDMAIGLLARFWADHDAGAGLLHRMIGDQNAQVRQTSLGWLAILHPGDSGTTPALARLARDPDSDVREAALEALLVHWPDAPETGDALDLCVRSPARDDRATARQALERHARGRVRDRDETARAAERGHSARRTDAVFELAVRWPDAPQTPAALQRGAVDDAAALRETSINLIAVLWPRDPDSLAAVLRAMRDTDADVRTAALSALSDDLHLDEPYPLIAAAVGDPHWGVRMKAMRILAIRWPERSETVTILRGLTSDADWFVRSVAFGLLHQVRPEGRWADACDEGLRTHIEKRHLLAAGHCPLPLTPSGLLPLWREDAASRERAALITAPLRGRDPDLRPALVPAALGDDHAVHASALDALAIWWPDDPETLDTLMATTGHSCARVRRFAYEALFARREGTAHLLAREALDDPAASIRMAAMCFLQAAGPLDIPTLLRLTADPDEEIATHAIESVAIQDHDDPAVGKRLREAAEACSDPSPRQWIEWR
ncbi:putative NTPase (NACHT family) [Mycobacterium tuberculosis]|nr:putative NTPase (NACHT family) [Mycobacterium tuberculosis]